MRRFAYANKEVSLPHAKAMIVVSVNGKVYQIQAGTRAMYSLNTLWLKKLRRLAVELMDGQVVHLVSSKKDIICIEEQKMKDLEAQIEENR